MIRYITFWVRMIRCVLRGGRAYYLWMGTLLAFVVGGVVSYLHHLTEGLQVTNMTDEVSWGIGIANFVYFVGVAAAAVLLVVPAYVYKRKDVKEVVLLGELLAVVAVVMCLLFIITDIGRPERLWHLMPPFGKLNLPSSLLAWDVLVFSGYLLLNLHIPGYLLYKRYLAQKPKPLLYLPLVFVSMFWAVSIHTVTAFLLSGLGSRHFWNTAILAPRFLISAGASGPALLLIIFAVVRRFTALKVKESVFEYLKTVLRISMPINLFLLGCEFFADFYTGSHAPGAHYLYMGLNGHHALQPFIYTAITFDVIAAVVFLVPKLRNNPRLMFGGAILTIVGIWIEKGVGLVFPGFIPTPLGEVVEYSPNMGEIFVSVGIAALGALVFTAMAKIVVAIQMGELRLDPNKRSPEDEPHAEEPAPAAPAEGADPA